MSYVVTIKLSSGQPPLTSQDFVKLVKDDGTLSGGQGGPIIWNGQSNGRLRYINMEAEQLWTDDLDDDADYQFLDKLRSIAGVLGGRLFGEEGDDITDADGQTPESPPLGAKGGLLLALTLIGSVLIMPFLFLWLILRIFWHFLVRLPFRKRFGRSR